MKQTGLPNAMFTDPGTCPAANSSPGRTSSAISPALSMPSSSAGRNARSGGNSESAAAPVRLISASLAKYSGRAGRLLVSCANELFPALDLQGIIGQPLGTNRRRALGAHILAAKRSRSVRRIHQHAVGKRHQLRMQAVVQQPRQLRRSMPRRQIRPPHVADE